jgi:hypothetical protein
MFQKLDDPGFGQAALELGATYTSTRFLRTSLSSVNLFQCTYYLHSETANPLFNSTRFASAFAGRPFTAFAKYFDQALLYVRTHKVVGGGGISMEKS